jgi:integrase
MSTRHQRGYIFEASSAFHVRYNVREIVDGQTVIKQRSHRLCTKDVATGHGTKSSKAVRLLCEAFMREVNAETPTTPEAVTVVKFWEGTYLPFIKEHLKPSTVQGYIHIWNQHLKPHFGNTLLKEYKTPMGSMLFTNLARKYRPRTIQHIKFLASSIFAHAVATGLCDNNPIRDAKVLGRMKPNGETESYTIEEVQALLNALVQHVDLQLIMALACFLGLRKGEIQGLQWSDIEGDVIHVRRAVVRGVVGTPKSRKSVRCVPLIAPVRLLVGLWRSKSTSAYWLFPTATGKPVDLRDVAALRIRPALRKAGVPWKGYHAGRRGLGTMLRTLTGNSNAGRDVLGHATTQVHRTALRSRDAC